MALGVWLRRVPNRLRQRVQRPDHLSVHEFQHQATCERMRVDRNGSQLAILTFRLAAGKARPADYEFLTGTLSRRLRATDTVGLLPDGRVGVLLPDTDASGAWKVASDICGEYAVGDERPDCEVHIYPDGFDDSWSDDTTDDAAEEPVGVANPSSGDARSEAFFAQSPPAWKRAMDVFGAVFGLVLSIPIIAIGAMLMRLTSRGPIFFRQQRDGLGSKPFTIYKLRTMHLGAHRQQAALREFSDQDGPAFKMRDDPRTTTVGRWLRALSIDELPQFWNVLIGQMSLVGPRPLPVEESRRCRPWQRRRLATTPGMTCIWQVRGRNTVSFDDWVRMDLRYMASCNLWNDVSLIFQTVPAVITRRGPR